MQEHAHWCAQVEERVRAEVRALRIDPMHDGTQVLSIIERIGADVVIGSCDSHDEQPSVASDVASVVTAVLQAPIRTAFWPIEALIMVESSGRLDYIG